MTWSLMARDVGCYSYAKCPVITYLPYIFLTSSKCGQNLATKFSAHIVFKHNFNYIQAHLRILRTFRVPFMSSFWLMGRWVRNVFTRAASSPRNFPNSAFKVISDVEKLEEESLDWYKSSLFYPVRIGEVFQSRYQVLGKLGYGLRSTAWLCRGLRWVRQNAHKARTLLKHC